jgi:hypothetical protein
VKIVATVITGLESLLNTITKVDILAMIQVDLEEQICIKMNPVTTNIYQTVKYKFKNISCSLQKEQDIQEIVENGGGVGLWFIYEALPEISVNSKMMDFKGAIGAYGLLEYKKMTTQEIFFIGEKKFYLDYIWLNNSSGLLIFYDLIKKFPLGGYKGLLTSKEQINKNLFVNAMKEFWEKYISMPFSSSEEIDFILELYINKMIVQNLNVLWEVKDLRENLFFLMFKKDYGTECDAKKIITGDIIEKRIISFLKFPYKEFLGSHYRIR